MNELGGKDSLPTKNVALGTGAAATVASSTNTVDIPEPTLTSINDIDDSDPVPPKKIQTVTHVDFREMLSKVAPAAPTSMPLQPSVAQTQPYWNQYAAYQQYGYQVPGAMPYTMPQAYTMPSTIGTVSATAYAAYGYPYAGVPQAYSAMPTMTTTPSLPYAHASVGTPTIDPQQQQQYGNISQGHINGGQQH